MKTLITYPPSHLTTNPKLRHALVLKSAKWACRYSMFRDLHQTAAGKTLK